MLPPPTQETIEPEKLQQEIEAICQYTLKKTRKTLLSYSCFHLGAFAFLALQLIAVLFSLATFSQNISAAFFIASLFLSSFSYMILLFYFQAKKPDQFLHLQKNYLEQIEKIIPFSNGDSEYHMAVSQAIYRLVERLENSEYTLFFFSKTKRSSSIFMQKLSAFLHWKDLLRIKELLLSSSIEELIQLVKSEPIDLEAHASLAEAHLNLGKTYLDPRKKHPHIDFPWIPKDYANPLMEKKFRFAAQRAIEEFKILDEYVPHDPWVHAQLANIYHDLEMIKQEIGEYEKILEIAPNDKQVLFRLGILYFQQGHNAKGLHIYRKLKDNQEDIAAELISYYGGAPLSVD